MMCTVCYTIWFPILACQSSWHYTFTTRQCFQDCLLRLHIRYSEGRQNPNIAPNSTQEVKEIQILSSIKFRWQIGAQLQGGKWLRTLLRPGLMLSTHLFGKIYLLYICPRRREKFGTVGKRDPNYVLDSTQMVDRPNIAPNNSRRVDKIQILPQIVRRG